MLQYQPLLYTGDPSLTEDDLPYSDNKPVDNELQLLLPILLRATLAMLWAEHQDWFFGVNMGIYHRSQPAAIGPDAFLSLGVPRYKREQGRLSYVVAHERNIVPQWVLEIVSQTPGGEYDDKFEKYAQMGVLYYLIYNPNHWKRDRHEPFELYRLEQGQYIQQQGNPVWMPELGLGIGTARGRHEGLGREWLYWYDENGQQHPAPEDAIEQERQVREQTERQYQRERALRVQAEQIARTLVVQQLTRRLGELPEATRSQINQLSMLQLEALGDAVLELSSQTELVAWLAQHQ
jgi:Uma2 family endonuclease